jgi:hypothetical protein
VDLAQGRIIEHRIESAGFHECRLQEANCIIFRPRPKVDPQIDKFAQRFAPPLCLAQLGGKHDCQASRRRRVEARQPHKLRQQIGPGLAGVVDQTHRVDLLQAVFDDAVGNQSPQTHRVGIVAGRSTQPRRQLPQEFACPCAQRGNRRHSAAAPRKPPGRYPQHQ